MEMMQTADRHRRTRSAVCERLINWRSSREIRSLERGSVFIGEYLHLYAGGTKEAPVVVDAYGEGALPRIEADGNGIWYQNYGGHLDNVVHTWKGYLSSAVLLYDAEYISIRNLEITNNPCIKNERLNQADRMNRTGVSVIAQNHGTLHQIELDHLYIHDVEGNIYDKHLNNGGIYMSVSRPDDEEKTGIARYDGIHIHHCKVENCRRWGIAAGYTYQHDKFTTLELPDEVVKTYGSTNVVIEHNFVKDIGGDGITPMYCFEPLIQYNISENIAVDIHPDLYNEEGNRGGMTAAAIWPWKCKPPCSSTTKPTTPSTTRTDRHGTLTPATEPFTSTTTAATMVVAV